MASHAALTRPALLSAAAAAPGHAASHRWGGLRVSEQRAASVGLLSALPTNQAPARLHCQTRPTPGTACRAGARPLQLHLRSGGGPAVRRRTAGRGWSRAPLQGRLAVWARRGVSPHSPAAAAPLAAAVAAWRPAAQRQRRLNAWLEGRLEQLRWPAAGRDPGAFCLRWALLLLLLWSACTLLTIW